MTVWVGADWDRDKCVVVAECGDKVVRAKVKRDPLAVRQWVAKFDGCRVVVGIEAGDPLWVRLWEGAGAEVFVFDPQKAKRYAQSLSSSKANDDKRSADTLQAQVKSEAHRAAANRAMPAELRGLDRMLTARNSASREVNRYTNRLDAVLRQVHPALRNALGRLDTVAAVRLLRTAPTPKAWAELTADEQHTALGRFRAVRRMQVSAAIGDDWAQMEALEDQAARFQVRQIVALVEVALAQKSQAKQQLDAAAADNPAASLVSSVHGLGAFLSAGAAIALDGSEDQRDAMARRTGTAPVTTKSGIRGDARPGVRMRRSSGSTLRKVGYLIAVQLVARHAWAKAQFAHYKAKGIRTAAAYRRISRSFSRVLFAIVRDGVPFNETTYVTALKRRGVVWAAGL